ncbi:MAG: tRNA (guanine(46)-N(7))-methyltransferase TrmB [Holosporales bacterium]|jgi:tRNA (guanine-N7-)-methyltransferase|nr:tRNA (guanine(46)-N(7))-methyltransferase TrmB [Holosporales bacterium]
MLSPREERLYGRKRAHQLRKGLQCCLKTYVAEEARANILALFVFPSPFAKIRLEIGFGAGERLLTQAVAHPEIAFIGAEPFENGFAQAYRQAETFPNLFLYQGDGRALCALLPENALDGVDILFPDPWPKRRHWKRRLVQKTFLQELARLLKPAGEVHFASDCLEYVASVIKEVEHLSEWSWSQEQRTTISSLCTASPLSATAKKILSQHSLFFARPDLWPMTRYEEKAHMQGRSCCYLSFRKV